MKKADKNPSLINASPSSGAVTVQMPWELLEALEDSHSAFFGLCIEAGRQVLGTMMEADRVALCGPEGRRRCTAPHTKRTDQPVRPTYASGFRQ